MRRPAVLLGYYIVHVLENRSVQRAQQLEEEHVQSILFLSLLFSLAFS